MNSLKASLLIIAACTAIVTVSACGGGGGSSTGDTPAVTYSIMGIVSGAPQGTTVTLSGTPNKTTTTNSIGFYQFTGLSSSGSYTVTPSMPGYTLFPASIPITINSANATNRNFSVVFGIAGSVKTGGGSGISGATITLVNSSGSATTRTTDPNGNYTAFGLAAGTYTLSASAGGYAMNPYNQKATVTCDVRAGLDFTATAGSTYSILGTVVTDTTTFLPTANAPMILSGDNTGVVYTSASGTYAFSSLLNGGSYTVAPAASYQTYYQSVTPPAVLSGSDLVWDFVARPRPGPGPGSPPAACLNLSGTISGPASSASTIDILYRSYTFTTTATTDGSGNYLKSVPSGSFVITPSKIGYTFAPPRICGGDSSSPCTVSSTVTATNSFTSQ